MAEDIGQCLSLRHKYVWCVVMYIMLVMWYTTVEKKENGQWTVITNFPLLANYKKIVIIFTGISRTFSKIVIFIRRMRPVPISYNVIKFLLEWCHVILKYHVVSWCYIIWRQFFIRLTASLCRIFSLGLRKF